jgi:hypothetical protein
MMKKHVIGGLVLLMALGLTACAKPPQQDIDAAKASVEAARNAEAGTYAADSLAAAEEAWRQVEAELAVQEEKFFKSYKKTSELVAAAKAAADKAAADAVAGKEAAKVEAEAALAAAQTAIDTASAAVAAAPKSKDRKADIEQMMGDLETLKTSLADAQNQYNSGDYKGAKSSADRVANEAAAIEADVSQAQAKMGA